MPSEGYFLSAALQAWQVIQEKVEILAGEYLNPEAMKELEAMQTSYIDFWAKKVNGDKEADKDLEFIHRRAELLAARMALSANAAMQQTLTQVLKIAADLGAALLQALIYRA